MCNEWVDVLKATGMDGFKKGLGNFVKIRFSNGYVAMMAVWFWTPIAGWRGYYIHSFACVTSQDHLHGHFMTQDDGGLDWTLVGTYRALVCSWQLAPVAVSHTDKRLREEKGYFHMGITQMLFFAFLGHNSGGHLSINVRCQKCPAIWS